MEYARQASTYFRHETEWWDCLRAFAERIAKRINKRPAATVTQRLEKDEEKINVWVTEEIDEPAKLKKSTLNCDKVPHDDDFV